MARGTGFIWKVEKIESENTVAGRRKYKHHSAPTLRLEIPDDAQQNGNGETICLDVVCQRINPLIERGDGLVEDPCHHSVAVVVAVVVAKDFPLLLIDSEE